MSGSEGRKRGRCEHACDTKLGCSEHAVGTAGSSHCTPLPGSRAIDDKYSRREEYRGFTQDFKEKDGYKPDVKIEYVDETGRKLTPKEVSRVP